MVLTSRINMQDQNYQALDRRVQDLIQDIGYLRVGFDQQLNKRYKHRCLNIEDVLLLNTTALNHCYRETWRFSRCVSQFEYPIWVAYCWIRIAPLYEPCVAAGLLCFRKYRARLTPLRDFTAQYNPFCLRMNLLMYTRRSLVPHCNSKNPSSKKKNGLMLSAIEAADPRG